MNIIPIPSMLNLIRKELAKQGNITVNSYKIVILINQEELFFEVPVNNHFKRYNAPDRTKMIIFSGIESLAKKYKKQVDEKNDFYKDYDIAGVIVQAKETDPFFELLLEKEDHKTKLKFEL